MFRNRTSESTEEYSSNCIAGFPSPDVFRIAVSILGLEPDVWEHYLSKRKIYDALKANKFMKHYDPSIIQSIMDSMYMQEHSEGEIIMDEKRKGKHLLIFEEGEFQIQEGIAGKIGEIYGVEEFLMHYQKIKKIKAISKCKVWILDRKEFKRIMKSSGVNLKNKEILENFCWFKGCNEETIEKIADAITIEYFGTNETLKLRENILYIISNGTVRITQNIEDQGKGTILQVLNRGDHFEGETNSTNKIIAFAQGVELLTIEMGFLNGLIGENIFFRQQLAKLPKSQDSCSDVELADLEDIGMLGSGSFGRVYLVRHSKNPDNTRYFALKEIGKYHTCETLQQTHVIAEREILLSIEHPFIVRLYKTFRSSRYVYMLFEACLGGKLGVVLCKKGSFNQETARFVAASAVEVLDYLHNKNILYRDLKTDNIVIDQYGYVKLVDFGFVKHLGYPGRTWSFCGTPCYMAPEIILNVSHDRAVDFWALGLMIYEMLCGCNMFNDWNPPKAYEEIMAGIENVKFPYKCKGLSEDLVRKLCTRNPSERLGYNSINDIKKHKWFAKFNWEALISRTMKPPKCLIPSLKHAGDMSNFDDQNEDNTQLPPKDLSNWDHIFEQ